MANPTPLDIDMSAVDFAAAHAALHTLKLDNPRTRADADSKLRAIAAWANHVDDCALAFQSRLQDHATSIAALEAEPGGVIVEGVDSETVDPATSILFDGNFAVVDEGGGQASVSIDPSALALAADTLYDQDFSELANNTLADGPEIIDGLSWTQVSLALLGVAAVTNGQGIVFDVGSGVGTNTTFTSSGQSTYHLYLPLSSIPGYDPRFDLIVEAYFSTLTSENSGEGVFVGLWGPSTVPSSGSATRVRWAGLFNSAGSRVLRSTSQTTATSTDDTRTTHDVVGFRISGQGVGSTWSGVYAAGFPAAVSPGTNFPTLAGAADPMLAQGVRLVIGVATVNDASATSIYTLRRLRVRRA